MAFYLFRNNILNCFYWFFISPGSHPQWLVNCILQIRTTKDRESTAERSRSQRGGRTSSGSFDMGRKHTNKRWRMRRHNNSQCSYAKQSWCLLVPPPLPGFAEVSLLRHSNLFLLWFSCNEKIRSYQRWEHAFRTPGADIMLTDFFERYRRNIHRLPSRLRIR